eukprot:6331867-Alexandrium_andersonii.AAC.1
MSASLVGSEMCIRDRRDSHRDPVGQAGPRADPRSAPAGQAGPQGDPVSYTHLTLPTICSV